MNISPNAETGQFSDYLKKCMEFSGSEEYRRQLSYWESEYEGFEPPAVENKKVSFPLEREHYFTVSRDMLYEFARKNNSTVFNAVMLAVSLLYAEIFDTPDTAAGFVSSDRRDPHFMKSAGNYARMLGIRLRLNCDMTFREALRKIMSALPAE